MKLSILVPAYNESATVATILRRLAALELDKEIVLVDDGSSDDTFARAQALRAEIPELRVFRLPENRGKGAAIRRALDEARGEVAVVQDADLEYDPADIVRLHEELCARELPAIYGSRRLGGRSAAFRRRYYYGGALLSWFTNLLYGSRLTDEPTCYKMVRTELLRSLDLRCEGFEFCPEVTAKLLRRGIEIPELQISYAPRSLEEGKKIRLRDALEAFWVLLKLRYQRSAESREVVLAPRDRLFAPLLPFLLLALAFCGVVFGGKTLLVGPGMPGVFYEAGPDSRPYTQPPVMDTVSAYIDEPLAAAMGGQLASRRVPLWNPDNGGGAPLLGNMQSAPLSPFRWPVMLSRSPWVGDLMLLVRLLVAGIFTFLFLRSRAARTAAALAGTGAFMLCGYFVLHVPMHHLNVEVLLPALIYFSDRVGRAARTSRADLLALVAVIWMSVVGGNPEATMAVLLFAGLFALAHLHLWGARRLLPLGGACLVAFGLALPYLLPAVEYLRHSAHHHGAATGLDHYRAWMGLAWFQPGAFRFGTGGVDPMAPAYLGSAVIALAAFGWRRGRSELPVRLFAACALVLVLKFLGAPLVNALGRIPLLDLLIFYKYGNPILAFCAAGLLAAALGRLGEDRRSGAGFPWRVLPPVAVLLAAWGFFLAARSRPEAQEGLVQVAALGPRFFLFGGGALVLVLLACLRGLPRRATLPWLACALVLAELVSAAWGERPERRDTLESPGYVAFLQERLHRSRAARDDLPRCFGIGGPLPPNINAALGIPDIRLHDGLYVERYARYVAALLSPNARVPQFDGCTLRRPGDEALDVARRLSGFHLDRDMDARWLEQLEQRGRTIDLAEERDALGYELAGVRFYLIGATELALVPRLLSAPGGRWRIAYPEWLQGLSIPMLAREAVRVRLANEHLLVGDLMVLENTRAMPRAYVVPRVLAASSLEESVRALEHPRFQPRSEAVVEGPVPAELRAASVEGFEGRVELVAHLPDEVHLRTSTSRAAMLILLDTYYPGWTAEVDGEPVAIQPGNVMFRAVEVPAGRSRVVFRYRPASWRWGLWLALAAGIVLAFWLVSSGRGRKRPS